MSTVGVGVLAPVSVGVAGPLRKVNAYVSGNPSGLKVRVAFSVHVLWSVLWSGPASHMGPVPVTATTAVAVAEPCAFVAVSV